MKIVTLRTLSMPMIITSKKMKRVLKTLFLIFKNFKPSIQYNIKSSIALKPPKDHVCSKKLVDLSKPKEYVKALCYIPEKNRLLALFTDDHRRIKDYNTNKLSLVTTIICKRALSSIRYCPHLSKTLALTANNEI